MITTRIGDYEYRFATRANREVFLQDPERYLAKEDESKSPSRAL